MRACSGENIAIVPFMKLAELASRQTDVPVYPLHRGLVESSFDAVAARVDFERLVSGRLHQLPLFSMWG